MMSAVRHKIRETGREYALRVITERIINLKLPPGSMVSESELAWEMGLSRTPVREALIELNRIQIVMVYPQKGSTIALIDYAMVEEARYIRYMLEMNIVEQVCRTVLPDDQNRLERNVKLQAACLENKDLPRLLKLDNAFHKSLFDIARKPMVYQLMQSMQIHFDRVRMMSLEVVKDTKIVQDHQAILEAIIKRDAAAAQAMMDRHLSRYQIDEQALRLRYPGYFVPQDTINP
jgi:DNA-binding GntR family transcriptional regulator